YASFYGYLKRVDKSRLRYVECWIAHGVVFSWKYYVWDIHRICPHPINPCVVTLNGDELLEVIRVSLTKEVMQQQLKGFGFRGEVIGRMVFSGLKIETKQHPDGSEYVIQAYLADKPVLSENIYRVATAD